MEKILAENKQGLNISLINVLKSVSGMAMPKTIKNQFRLVASGNDPVYITIKFSIKSFEKDIIDALEKSKLKYKIKKENTKSPIVIELPLKKIPKALINEPFDIFSIAESKESLTGRENRKHIESISSHNNKLIEKLVDVLKPVASKYVNKVK